MEIVDFREKTFNEIPEQDNPAYDTNDCLLICKSQKQQTGCFVVMKIDNQNKEDSVTQLGLFWTIEMALIFANAIN